MPFFKRSRRFGSPSVAEPNKDLIMLIQGETLIVQRYGWYNVNHVRMEQIGRYRILGELGRGAMGVVYRAEDPTIGRIVAIKTIRLKDATSDEERQFLQDRLFREARSAGMLSHPNIVTIYDVSEQGGLAYIAMEYVDGPTLDKLLIH